MAAVTRNDMNANVLQTWLYRKTLKVFEPKLHFHAFGQKPDDADGYNTISWAKFDQIAASSVTTGTTSTDGVTPTETAFNATVITATPVQYRVVVNLSDMVVKRNVINFVNGAIRAVAEAMARKVDTVIQTEVMAGTNVIYADPANNTARTDLDATDVLTTALINQASAKLDSLDAPMFGDMYVAIIHSFQVYDLRNATAAGSWLEVNKYVTNGKLFSGEIGSINGVRIVKSSHVQTFSSTVTVYPALVLGEGAYGVADFDNMQVYKTGFNSSDSDPLAQRIKVGAKVAFVAKRLQENAMIRIETGATAI